MSFFWIFFVFFFNYYLDWMNWMFLVSFFLDFFALHFKMLMSFFKQNKCCFILRKVLRLSFEWIWEWINLTFHAEFLFLVKKFQCLFWFQLKLFFKNLETSRKSFRKLSIIPAQIFISLFRSPSEKPFYSNIRKLKLWKGNRKYHERSQRSYSLINISNFTLLLSLI